MYTVGKLATEFKLSRSTLLYYDKIGLLSASCRSKSNYRLYSKNDVERLRQIIHHREAGISLENISRLLVIEKSDVTDVLSDRLEKIQEEINILKKQEQMILSVLIQKANETGIFDKKTWSELLNKTGYSHYEWHRNFEESSSDEHERFLKALGMSDKEIMGLRQQLKNHE